MTNNEIWLLNRLKHDEVYTSNKGKKCYLEDGTYIEILGRYSYPDISYISHRSNFLDIVSFILDWDKTCSTRTSLNFLLERGEVLDITRDRRINKILGE